MSIIKEKEKQKEIIGIKQDIFNEQLIKIPSQKIISFTDFFCCKNENRFLFPQSLQLSIKKRDSTNKSFEIYVQLYSCSSIIGQQQALEVKLWRQKNCTSFWHKTAFYRYGLKRVWINNNYIYI